MHRAEQSGYGAIVVTLDTYLLSWRERDIRNAYLPFIHGEGLSNYFSDPVFREAIGGSPRWHKVRTLEYFWEVFSDPSRTWDDLGRLKRATRLPLLAKGVLHPDDARRAVDCWVEGIIVSNHGGRQLDGAIAAIDALPGVVDAVEDRTNVLFDSGIRGGPDVIKAMALGALRAAEATLLLRPRRRRRTGRARRASEPDRRHRPDTRPVRMLTVRGTGPVEPRRSRVSPVDPRPMNHHCGYPETLRSHGHSTPRGIA